MIAAQGSTRALHSKHTARACHVQRVNFSRATVKHASFCVSIARQASIKTRRRKTRAKSVRLVASAQNWDRQTAQHAVPESTKTLMDRELARAVFATLAHSFPPHKPLPLCASIVQRVSSRINVAKLPVKARCACQVRSQRRRSTARKRHRVNDAPRVRIHGGRWGQLDAQVTRARQASLASETQRATHAQVASSKTFRGSTVARVRAVSLASSSPHVKGRRRRSNAVHVQLASIRMNPARKAVRGTHADQVNFSRLLAWRSRQLLAKTAPPVSSRVTKGSRSAHHVVQASTKIKWGWWPAKVIRVKLVNSLLKHKSTR